MKLKDGVVIYNLAGNPMVVCSGEALDLLSGMIRNNATANFIFEQLMQETTEEKIVDAMVAKYDAPRDVIAADVHDFVGQIRALNLLEE